MRMMQLVGAIVPRLKSGQRDEVIGELVDALIACG